MTVEIIGVDRLVRTLGDAERKITALATANRDVAAGIVAAANPPRRTGRLAGSLHASGTDDAAVVDSSLVYAPVIERGWRRHNIQATHFLANAENARRAATLNRYREHCRDSIAGVKGA